MLVELLDVVAVRGDVLPVGPGPGPAGVVAVGEPVPLRRGSGEVVCGWRWVELVGLVATAGETAAADRLSAARWRLTAAAGAGLEFGPRFDFEARRGDGSLAAWDVMAGILPVDRVEVISGEIAGNIEVACPLTAAGLVKGGAWSVENGGVVNELGRSVSLVSLRGKKIDSKNIGVWLGVLFTIKQKDRGDKDFARIEALRRGAGVAGLAASQVAAVESECQLMRKFGWSNGY